MNSLRLSLLMAALLAGCTPSLPPVDPLPPIDLNDMPMVQGNEIELSLRNSNHFWDFGMDHAAEQLNAQHPDGLDQHLQLVSVVMPRPIRSAEVSVRFAIDSQGHVINVEMRRLFSVGAEMVLADTASALPLWRFSPPTQGGLPISYCCVRLRLEYLPNE